MLIFFSYALDFCQILFLKLCLLVIKDDLYTVQFIPFNDKTVCSTEVRFTQVK